jgi:hypothetical protein
MSLMGVMFQGPGHPQSQGQVGVRVGVHGQDLFSLVAEIID